MADAAELTPHGHILEDARIRGLDISGREAARRADISEARWRQVVTGYQKMRGQRIPVNPTARTLIAMAVAVGVDPHEIVRLAQIDSPPSRDLVDRIAREARLSAERRGVSVPAGSVAPDDQLLATDEEVQLVNSDPRLSQVQRTRVLRLIHERRTRERAAGIAETRLIIDALGEAG